MGMGLEDGEQEEAEAEAADGNGNKEQGRAGQGRAGQHGSNATLYCTSTLLTGALGGIWR